MRTSAEAPQITWQPGASLFCDQNHPEQTGAGCRSPNFNTARPSKAVATNAKYNPKIAMRDTMSGTKGLKITAIPPNAATQKYPALRAARIAARHATTQTTRGPMVSMSAVMCQKAIPVHKITAGTQVVIPREIKFNPGSNAVQTRSKMRCHVINILFSTPQSRVSARANHALASETRKPRLCPRWLRRNAPDGLT